MRKLGMGLKDRVSASTAEQAAVPAPAPELLGSAVINYWKAKRTKFALWYKLEWRVVLRGPPDAKRRAKHEEVDNLTKRAKFSENSFLAVFQQLYDVCPHAFCTHRFHTRLTT
eukprot:7272368-Pyramimonas_sp.AAC.3